MENPIVFYTHSFGPRPRGTFIVYSKINDLLGLLRIFLHTNALRRILLLLTLKISLMMVIVLTYMAISSLKTPTQPLVASVSSKFCHFLKKYIYHNFCVLSYTCTYVGTYRDKNLYRWNVSVSDHCCLHCDGVVYKADTVIDTTQHEDECMTTKTTECRIIPGKFYFY